MRQKFARVNEVGLTIPPSNRDCVGESCRVAEQNGSCWVSKHHMYFPEVKFAKHSELAYELRKDPNAIVNLARCRHELYHQEFQEAVVPRDYVIERFLTESAICQQIGLVTARIHKTEAVIRNLFRIAEYADSTNNHQVLELCLEKADRAIQSRSVHESSRVELFDDFQTCEIIPPIIAKLGSQVLSVSIT